MYIFAFDKFLKKKRFHYYLYTYIHIFNQEMNNKIATFLASKKAKNTKQIK